MLTRAARRRHTLHHLQDVAARIQMPWLCPVLHHSAFATSRSSQVRHSTTTRPIPPRLRTILSQSTQTRQLASAAPLPEAFERSDDYLPFSSTHNSISTSQHRPPVVADIPHLDLSKILMIDATAARPSSRVTTSKVLGSDVKGSIEEIEVTLAACLEVHRWDRAFAILRQLSLYYPSTSATLRDRYNQVLASMAEDLINNRNLELSDRINDWIEVDMHKAGVKPDAQTFALKVKVALETLSGSKRDRTVRRYWEMAQEYGLENEVASLRNILDERDLGKLSEIRLLEMGVLPDEMDVDYTEPEMVAVDEVVSSPTIHLRETEQRGHGLKALRHSLSLFSDPTRYGKDLDPQVRQEQLEQDAVDAAMQRWELEHEKNVKLGIADGVTSSKLGALLWQWHVQLGKKIADELKLVDIAEQKSKRSQVETQRVDYGPFLRLLPPEKIAAVTLISSMQFMTKAGMASKITMARLVTIIGRAFETEVNAEQRRKRNSVFYKAARAGVAVDRERNQPGLAINLVDSLQSSEHSASLHKNVADSREARWSSVILTKVGAILCELMFSTAKIKVTRTEDWNNQEYDFAQPIWIRHTGYRAGRKVGFATLHEDFINYVVSMPPGDMIAKHLPMVCEPRPWQGMYNGGYLTTSQGFLRNKDSEISQRKYAEAAASRGDLDQLFAGVDVLGRTGWKINRDVFAVMAEAWNSGEAIANIPPLTKTFPELAVPTKEALPAEKLAYLKESRARDNELGGIHSNRCFQNLQMEIANAYLDETFYLPHNIDFRGRAYPLPPHLNQMGADNSRGLMLFAQGKPLGETGLRWLQIHLANVYGFDKASLIDRAQFSIDHIDDIRDSVRNPLNGRKWWLRAEDPWQCLATCFEITKALDSPDPRQFISHLPVHQDGSCNGLQHYAALGGDVVGAKQVNLEPGDKPADVYSGVAEMVKAEIKVDAENGHELAKVLDGKITRKIVKQTVMTNVYGVTLLGAIRQVRKQIETIIPETVANKTAGVSATYIAKKIFKSLGAMFSGAHSIQYWLGDCANRITSSISPSQISQLQDEDNPPPKAGLAAILGMNKTKTQKKLSIDQADFRSSVVWTTPLKLPVVQPYRVSKGRTVETSMQYITLKEPSETDAVSKRKQLQAFPPNFIHSLDATHMVLSALKADEQGLSFSAVHDSFWTHATDIDTLSTLLRDAFVRMHSEDIVGRLAAEFQVRYSGHYYLAQIGKNNKVAKAISQFRKEYRRTHKIPGKKTAGTTRRTELMLEVRRKQLLESDDPAEREEGRNMVTPYSLYEQLNGEKYLFHQDSLGETAMGRVPDEVSDAVLAEEVEAKTVDLIMHTGNVMESLKESIADSPDDVEHDLEENEATGKSRNEKPIRVTSTDDTLLPPKSEGESAQPEKSGNEIDQKPKTKRTPGTAKSRNNQVWLWLPLTFRDVPKRGEWDVTRLRESRYFFS